ncbi:uncharacterized protein TNCV_1832171 [Trichonephila clavipes]|nr:uncharacterized protein TNCV_1832171 [Trichonephila clavipes]
MNGCVAAISVDTGKVLDIEVICRPTVQHVRDFRLCQETLNMSRQKPTTYVSVISQALHQKWKLWGLPEYFFDLKKNRRLHYTQYYGDGDSKAFMSVKDTYGLNSVTKFECIGHVQKRVDSRL